MSVHCLSMERNREMVAIPPLQPANIDNTTRAGEPAEQVVGVQKGLLVCSHDGEILGQVGEFVIDMAGNLTSFFVRAGAHLAHDVRVPMHWINHVTRDRITLRLTATEVLSANIANRRSVSR
jgi:hypothetical protein